jgi:hypothetical protein
MVRSIALNPASIPFFPGGLRASEDEGSGDGLGFGHITREHDRISSSSPSISPSEFRSVRSSPSPPRDDCSSGRFQSSPTFGEESHHSSTFRHSDSNRLYSGIEMRVSREANTQGGLGPLPEGEDTAQAPSHTESQGPTGSNSLLSCVASQGHERLQTPPVPVNKDSSRSSSTNANRPQASWSPSSSLDSGSQVAASSERPFSFETQLKASPFIHDILDRLVRCEYSSREIQRDLGEVHRKVNLLVERSLGANSQPEFKDPFASPNDTAQNLISSPLFSPRGSGGIAPNQPVAPDDITPISQRLNTLTSSVGKLLAMQTQHHVPPPTSGLPGAQIQGPGPQHADIAPNQLMSPNQSILGHGLPNRPDLRPSPRAPNPPMRTWSVGALDLPNRPQDAPNTLNRQLGDKRRSVTSLMRRDSSGVCDSTKSLVFSKLLICFGNRFLTIRAIIGLEARLVTLVQ